jgi:MFS family permease
MSAGHAPGCFTRGGGCFKPHRAVESVPLLRQNSAAGLDARVTLLERTDSQGNTAEYRSFEDDDESRDGTTTSEATTSGRGEGRAADPAGQEAGEIMLMTSGSGGTLDDTGAAGRHPGGAPSSTAFKDSGGGGGGDGDEGLLKKQRRNDDARSEQSAGGGGRRSSGGKSVGANSRSGGGGGSKSSSSRRQPRKGVGTTHAWRAWLSALTIALGPFGTGLAMGYTRAAQGSLLCSAHQRRDQQHQHLSCPVGSVSDAQLALFENLLVVGAVAGALLGGWLIDVVGRRGALRIAAPPQLVGWLMVLVGVHSGAAQIGRVLTGMAAGVTSVAAHTLMAETAPAAMRGQLMAVCQLAFAAAVLVQNAFPAVVGDAAPHWRMLALGGALYSGAFMAIIGSVPESPRWLVARGRTVDAVEALAALRGGGEGAAPYEVEEEANAIVNSAQLAPPSSGAVDGGGGGRFYPWHLLTQRQLSRPMLVVVALMAFQQFGGVNLTLHSMSSDGGGGGSPPLSGGAALLAASALVQVVGCFVCSRLLSEGGPGRRTALLVSLAGMALSNAAIAVSQSPLILGGGGGGDGGGDGDGVVGIAGDALEVVATLTYAGAWAAGVGTVPWLVVGLYKLNPVDL